MTAEEGKDSDYTISRFSVAQVSLSISLHVQIIIFFIVVHTIAEELLRSF